MGDRKKFIKIMKSGIQGSRNKVMRENVNIIRSKKGKNFFEKFYIPRHKKLLCVKIK